jgi:colanic acid/amylovoran biosynthesis protein
MRILLIPSTFGWLNMGDVALMQVAVARLAALWPDAEIRVPTHDAARLAGYCPAATALPYDTWLDESFLFGRLQRALPPALASGVGRARRALEGRAPGLLDRATRAKVRLRGGDPAALASFLDAIDGADLVVVGGAGGFADRFPGYVNLVLAVSARAARRGRPTVMMSQGLGPLRDPALLLRARAVLPRLRLIALRERERGERILARLGVQPDRIVTTGDDAVELALAGASDTGSGGAALGVNVRIAPAAEVEPALIEALRPVLATAAARHGAPMLPVPIALQRELDTAPLRGLTGGDGGAELRTPELVIEQVGRCRVVVTGAYHAAVFALGQGIPAVCLARSEYYHDKFAGLVDLFGPGCGVVDLRAPEWPAALERMLDERWTRAPRLRGPLLAAARAQVEAGRAAYARVGAIAAPASLPASLPASG